MDDTVEEYEAGWADAAKEDEPARSEPVQERDEEPAVSGEAQDNQPAEPTQDEAAPEPPKTDPETTPTSDIWANATPEQKAAFEAATSKATTLEHRVKSDEGRLARFQRERDELRKRNSIVEEVAEQEDIGEYLQSDEWKKVKADYGDDLAPVFKLAERLATRNQTLERQVGSLSEAEVAKTSQAYLDQLTEEVPDMGDLFSSEGFQPWLDAQPKLIRDMVERNWEAVVDPAEVKAVLDLYRPHSGLVKETAAPSPPKQEIDRKREVQLQGARSSQSRSPIVTEPDTDDYAAGWKLAEREERAA